MRFVLLLALQIGAFYLLFDYLKAIEVVTLPGRLLGITILALVGALIQTVFAKRRISRFKFTTTVLIMCATGLSMIVFLPGYSVPDPNRALLLIIMASFISIFLGIFIPRFDSRKPLLKKEKLRRKSN